MAIQGGVKGPGPGGVGERDLDLASGPRFGIAATGASVFGTGAKRAWDACARRLEEQQPVGSVIKAPSGVSGCGPAFGIVGPGVCLCAADHPCPNCTAGVLGTGTRGTLCFGMTCAGLEAAAVCFGVGGTDVGGNTLTDVHLNVAMATISIPTAGKPENERSITRNCKGMGNDITRLLAAEMSTGSTKFKSGQ